VNRYPILTVKNLPAYGTIMLLWAGTTLLFAFLLRVFTAEAISWMTALIFAGLAVMSGMVIMFGASVVNLRKLRPGFERLAHGEPDPAIPSVWCPVLTMATRAAVDLSEKVHVEGAGERRDIREQ
jgi:hypothetical protein